MSKKREYVIEKVSLFLLIIIILILMLRYNFSELYIKENKNNINNINNTFNDVILVLNENKSISEQMSLNKTLYQSLINTTNNSIVLSLDYVLYNGSYFAQFQVFSKINMSHLCNLLFYDSFGVEIDSVVVIIPYNITSFITMLPRFPINLSTEQIASYYSCKVY